MNKPWWTEDCQEAVDNRKKALNALKKTQTNLNTFKLKYAQARSVIKTAMRKSWQAYVSKLNTRTPIKKTWDMIRKILGKRQESQHKSIKP